MPTPEQNERLAAQFSEHPAEPDQPAKFKHLRDTGRVLAEAIYDECPDGDDAEAAVRHVRLAVNAAVDAIVTEPKAPSTTPGQPPGSSQPAPRPEPGKA